MSERDPVTYSNMSYTTIEISSSLAAAQQQHIAQVRMCGACVLVWGGCALAFVWAGQLKQRPGTVTRCMAQHDRCAGINSRGGWCAATRRSAPRGTRWQRRCRARTACRSTALC
jgi:hypothetical protein